MPGHSLRLGVVYGAGGGERQDVCAVVQPAPSHVYRNYARRWVQCHHHLDDSDVLAWTQQQAETIRAGIGDDIDREHLAEAIEDWWKCESRLLWHDLRELLVWLVAYAYVPAQRLAHPHGYVRIIPATFVLMSCTT